MKTKEQAAKEYVINLSEPRKFGNIKTPRGAGIELMEAFKGGVEFAQQWISVDDELPEEGAIVLLFGYFPKLSRGDLDKKNIETGKYLGGHFFTKCGICLYNQPTHWRPIELK